MKTIDGLPLTEAILKAAIATFSERGYDTASMDEVAARASTTKRTVYAHFGNKEGLFRSALGRAVELVQSELPTPDDLTDPAGELTAFAIGFSDISTWRNPVRLQRVVIGGAGQFSDLGAMLHREVIERAEGAVADYLQRLDASRGGGGDEQHHRRLAGYFLNLTTARQRFATLFGAREPIPDHPHRVAPPDTDHATIREAVGLFLRGSGLDG
ncbi:TetR/AcrR family transcriptional regulator [Desertihabitans aurantiacus]|uniref:TetR/AcrR family transcriptional regulator n=1 Tax=Desertihabitans aurantiacus TaxID=2282477 RepID=UPI000DF797C5|nr:TetR/AcrR family transcriptional regulator [Desertihabitans aurantiacus]